MPTASRLLVSRIRAGERVFTDEQLHDEDLISLNLGLACVFHGADLRCARLQRVRISPEALERADLRLAHIKRRSPLHRHLGRLEQRLGVKLLSRREFGKHLYDLQENDLERLRAIAAAVEEGDLEKAGTYVPAGSPLAKVIEAAQEPGENPIRRDLAAETRRFAGPRSSRHGG